MPSLLDGYLMRSPLQRNLVERGDTMLEDKKRLPLWARRALLAVAIVGPGCGAIATIAKTYYEVKSAKKSAAEADKNSEASYETLAPAVAELQEMSDEEQEWAHEMSDYTQDLENRIIRLEAYIDILSDRRNMPDPIPEAAARAPASVASTQPSQPQERKTARPVPDSLTKAKAYQQQRQAKQCPPDDPLCGLE